MDGCERHEEEQVERDITGKGSNRLETQSNVNNDSWDCVVSWGVLATLYRRRKDGRGGEVRQVCQRITEISMW